MEKVVARALELIKIPSVSGNREAIRKIIGIVKNEFEGKGFFVTEYHFEEADPVLLLANTPEMSFDILTIGHLDVVPAAEHMFTPVINDGKIHARGACDMKSQIAVNLEALLYAARYPDLKFGVLITTDEETTSNGIRQLARQDLPDARIVLDNDSGSLFCLTEKYKHPVSVRLKARGEAAHSSMPWFGKNAVIGLIGCIDDLQKHFPYYAKNAQIPGDTWVDTMTVTAFNSPTTYNVVPAEAEARINFRLTEKTSLQKLEEILAECAEKHDCSYEILLSSSGVYMDANHPIIRKYRQVAVQVLGRELSVGHSCGATDSRPFGQKSTIIMHSVDGGDLHGDHEYVVISSILQLLEIQKKFIDEAAAGNV